MIEIQLIIINEFGEFKGIKRIISNSEYIEVLKKAREFYINGSFDLTCEDGFMVFGPDIVKKSILLIKKEIVVENKNE